MTVICPGCGWSGAHARLCNGACPKCGYGNPCPPWRLLSLAEMLALPAPAGKAGQDAPFDEEAMGPWCDVAMGPFLRAVLAERAMMAQRDKEANP